MRLVFAGTPAGRRPVARRAARLPPRGRRGADPARRPGRSRPPAEAESPVAPPGRRGGHRGAQAGPRGATRSCPGPAGRARAGLLPGRRLRRPGATRSLLDLPPHGWVNLHFSLLPAWRGAAPVQHAMLHGDDVTGATTFRLERGARHRAGARRADRDRPAAATPPATCSDRLAARRRRPAGRHPRRAGDGRARRASRSRPTASASRPSSAPRTPGVDWSSPAFHVDRQVRACTPGARRLDDLGREERLGVGPVEPAGDERPRRPARSGSAAVEVLVGAGDGHAVRLGEVRPAGASGDGAPPPGPAACATSTAAALPVTGPPRAGQPASGRARAQAPAGRAAAGRLRPAAGRRRARRLRQPDAAGPAARPRPARPGRGVRDRAGLRRRCAAAARTTRCSPPASTGRWSQVDAPGARRAAARRPPAARRCGCLRTPRSARPSSWPGRWPARGAARSSTRCCAGSAGRTSPAGSRRWPRRTTTTRPATWRSCTRTRAGSCRPCATRSAGRWTQTAAAAGR